MGDNQRMTFDYNFAILIQKVDITKCFGIFIFMCGNLKKFKDFFEIFFGKNNFENFYEDG